MLFVLHYPIDARPGPEPATRRGDGRDRPRLSSRFPRDRAHGCASRFVWTRPSCSIVIVGPAEQNRIRRAGRGAVSNQLARADGLLARNRRSRGFLALLRSSFSSAAPAYGRLQDRKSTRLNSSHEWISYA